jgi:transcription elongation factor GreB
MSKAFTKETDVDDDAPEEAEALPAGVKNYMTPLGFAVLKDELRGLMNEERPKVVEVVSWAAGNGDRSENGDYIYGKKRLREIDRRIRYLSKRLESAVVVDPAEQKNTDQVFFGATVTYKRKNGEKLKVTVVGVDESEIAEGKISWLSPVAKALMKAYVGDVIELRTPSGPDAIEVLAIKYPTDKKLRTGKK